MCLCCESDGRLDDADELASHQSLEGVSADQPSIVDVYHGFCALHDVMSCIIDSRRSADNCGWCSAEVDGKNVSDGEVLPSELMSVRRHVSSISLPKLRLEVMEDVFSLLFSRIEHLRDSDDSPDRQTDSEADNSDKEVVSPKLPDFTFDAAGPNISCDSVLDQTTTSHELPPVENPRVEALTVESRGSPLEVSSSSVDGRSDELSGSQTLSNSSMQCGNESGFLVRDYMILDVLQMLHNCCKELNGELAVKVISVDDVNTVPRDKQAAELQKPRIEELQKHISNAQWRLRIAASPSARISPLSEHHHPKQRRQQSKQRRDSVTCKDSGAYPVTSDGIHTENAVIPRMLCRPESLQNLCLTEGRMADAEEVVKVCHLVSDARIVLVNIDFVICLDIFHNTAESLAHQTKLTRWVGEWVR